MKKTLARLALVAALVAPAVASAYVVGPTYPGKWGSATPGTGATVTWSLIGSGVSCASEFSGCTNTALSSFMPSGFLGEIQRAFDAWSAVADLTFVQVSDDGAAFNASSSSGNIRIGGHNMGGAGGTLAHGFYPPNNGNTASGDIHFDTAENWTIGFAGSGFDIFQVFAHELGHALGLNHATDPNALMYPYYSESFTGPQADDIAGMQYLYGPAAISTPEPVSEPSTLALRGLAALALVRRRKAQA
jgi:hypothetical protein